MVGHRDFLTFSLAEDVFALPLTQVREIVGLPPITRLPNAPAHLRGVINLRGAVVPIVDLREQLGLPGLPYGKFTVAILVEVAAATVGLVVDGVTDVVSLSDGEIDGLPPGLSTRVYSDFLAGLCQRGERTLLLLDVARVLTDEQRGVLSGRAPE